MNFGNSIAYVFRKDVLDIFEKYLVRPNECSVLVPDTDTFKDYLMRRNCYSIDINNTLDTRLAEKMNYFRTKTKGFKVT